MKVTLFLAISIDGFIAKSDGSVCWTDDDYNNYAEVCAQVGNLIVGRRTFDLMNEGGDFEKLPDFKNIVVLSSKSLKGKADKNVSWASTPQQALQLLEKQNQKEVILGGGASAARSFLEAKLIDEVQLDVEPFIFGSGCPLIGEISSQVDLKLLSTRQAGANTVRLHYTCR